MASAKDGREGVVLPLREPCSICGDDLCVEMGCLDQEIEEWVLAQSELQAEAAVERDDQLRLQALVVRGIEEETARREALDAEPPEPSYDDDDEGGTPATRGANRQTRARRSKFEIGDQVEIAKRLLTVLQGKSPAPLIRDDGALYRYEPADGIWREIDVDQQSRVIQDFSGDPVGEKARSLKINDADVRGAIRLAGSRAAHKGYFTSEHAIVGVAFADGFVTVDENGCHRRAHDPTNRARFGFGFKFELNAQPRMFLQFLDDLFRDDLDKAEKIAFIQEFGGIALLGLAPRYQKCLVATSKGGANGQNGKSQLAEIFCGVMPENSVACVRPQDLNNEYRRAELAGKLLNCVTEMPEGDILDSTAFKSVVTGDRIDGRRIRQDPFWFIPRAAGYYACNQAPGTSDFSRAFFRRFVFLMFNRVFQEGTKGHVPDIGKKIVRSERALVASWFLQGASRAMRQGKYTEIPSSETEIEVWRRSIDQVSMFLDEMATKCASPAPKGDKHDWSKASRVYDGYVAWAEESNHKPLARNKFGMRMEQAGYPSVHTEKGAYYPVKPQKGTWPVRPG